MAGTAYSIIPAGIAESVLHSFAGSNVDPVTDGIEPLAGLIQGSDGNFYGTTSQGSGGTLDCASDQQVGCGTVFKITPGGAESVLYTFGSPNPADDCRDAGLADGVDPQAALVQGRDGALYGTTLNGGAGGTAFKVTLAGQESTLWCFGLSGSAPSVDGVLPLAALVQGRDGNFYGTTSNGGTYDLGTVFKVTPDGTETVLYSFEGCDPGACGVSRNRAPFVQRFVRFHGRRGSRKRGHLWQRRKSIWDDHVGRHVLRRDGIQTHARRHRDGTLVVQWM